MDNGGGSADAERRVCGKISATRSPGDEVFHFHVAMRRLAQPQAFEENCELSLMHKIPWAVSRYLWSIVAPRTYDLYDLFPRMI